MLQRGKKEVSTERNMILRRIPGECFMFMTGVAVVHAGDMIVTGVIYMPNGMQ